jgi:hypothetical protein
MAAGRPAAWRKTKLDYASHKMKKKKATVSMQQISKSTVPR